MEPEPAGAGLFCSSRGRAFLLELELVKRSGSGLLLCDLGFATILIILVKILQFLHKFEEKKGTLFKKLNY